MQVKVIWPRSEPTCFTTRSSKALHSPSVQLYTARYQLYQSEIEVERRTSHFVNIFRALHCDLEKYPDKRFLQKFARFLQEVVNLIGILRYVIEMLPEFIIDCFLHVSDIRDILHVSAAMSWNDEISSKIHHSGWWLMSHWWIRNIISNILFVPS